ncbi:MAG: protein kinase [Gammaproteobacteria bacterium]|nr:protein kinase [Gammaproteobacteria bacterium]
MKPPKDNGNGPKKTGQNSGDRTIFRQQERTRIDNRHIPPNENPTNIRNTPNARPNTPSKPAQQVFANASGEHSRVLKGRFLLEKVLGVGGMGVVYKAKDRNKIEAHDKDPYVAIKVLNEEFKAHPESFIALQRESRKGQRIAHPNVVKVYDFDRDGDVVFMTMEYLEGRPLDQIIKQYNSSGLPRTELWGILNDVCSALIHAHAENIVHSDFKPGNIFITTGGNAKIFDFGIARAVANVDRHTGKTQDKTVFDAGSLGALTPAYASMEMLTGKKPDIRDDVYALGCITYEMLTGEHPFNKIPADEAYKRNLKPKRIAGIKTRQWKAIEKSLAFKREDRIESVEVFHELIFKKANRTLLYTGLLVVVMLAAIVVGFMVKPSTPTSQPAPPAFNRDELEFKIKYDIFKQKIDKLMADPTFTQSWEGDIWDEFKGMNELLSNRPDAWLLSVKEKLAELYLAKIKDTIDKKDFTRALALIENAYRYVNDPRILDAEKTRLAELIKAENVRRAKTIDEQHKTNSETQSKEENKKRIKTQFDLALSNVNQQLECSTRLNMRDFGIAVEKLRSLDLPRYSTQENTILIRLAECITQIGKTNPESATESKTYALRLFDNNRIISEIKISARDACDLSIAGLGARGERAVCRDKLPGIGAGPALVVIPGSGALPPFAIGKYEISVREINEFCASSNECSRIESTDSGLPVTNISIGTITKYLKWLSKLAAQKYRLPTKTEWVYAANANNRSHDPNRNCQLNSRGIEKGGQLVRINTGAQNGWGLVNYIGNAQELVYEKDMSLVAMGGSYEDPMDSCDEKLARPHSGKPDAITGFRLLREIQKND